MRRRTLETRTSQSECRDLSCITPRGSRLEQLAFLNRDDRPISPRHFFVNRGPLMNSLSLEVGLGEEDFLNSLWDKTRLLICL